MSGFGWQGLSLIGAQRGSPGGSLFHAVAASSGAALTPPFHAATAADVERAATLAAVAAPVLAELAGERRAALLHAIADAMEAARDDFVQLVPLETALPPARAGGELTRTVNQLRLFAAWVQEGSWVDARIDHADPQRTPLPKPDVRSMLRGAGPVAVFGASNFPLAFSVAGGDTASALAAGCPVIAKAHPAHPATSERAGLAIRAAVAQCGLPEGTFSLLFDADTSVGTALVRDPRMRAVAFTGSRQGGRALMDIAAARPGPIPVFAEMGSVNPVFVLPSALASRGEAIALQLHASATQAVGQFCTNPGLLIVPKGDAGDVLVTRLAQLFAATAPAAMLAAGIATRYAKATAELSQLAGVRVMPQASTVAGQGAAALFEVDAAVFARDSRLHEEIFGPASLVVRCDALAGMLELAQALDGQLTATIIADPQEQEEARILVSALTAIAGRVLMNGVPTGVEVGHAMFHGGPWPAASDARSGSVGTAAIERFCRRVCYQDIPDALLPDALREENPLRLLRLVDGQRRV